MIQEQKAEAVIAYCYIERYPDGFKCYQYDPKISKGWEAVGPLLVSEVEAKAELHKLRHGDGPVTQLQQVEAELATIYAARTDMQYYSEVDEIARDLARKLDEVKEATYIDDEAIDSGDPDDAIAAYDAALSNIRAILDHP